VSFRQHLQHLQDTFRSRLRLLREAQLREAAERATEARLAWAHYLGEIRRERNAVLAQACPDCGEFREPVSSSGRRLCCSRQASVDALVRLLRRLAGIGRAPEVVTRRHTREWSDWNAGLAGARGCGPSSWDNAVRAWDEAR